MQDRLIKVIFVKSEDNDADLFNKNLGGGLHWKHADKLLREETKEEREMDLSPQADRKGVRDIVREPTDQE